MQLMERWNIGGISELGTTLVSLLSPGAPLRLIQSPGGAGSSGRLLLTSHTRLLYIKVKRVFLLKLSAVRNYPYQCTFWMVK